MREKQRRGNEASRKTGRQKERQKDRQTKLKLRCLVYEFAFGPFQIVILRYCDFVIFSYCHIVLLAVCLFACLSGCLSVLLAVLLPVGSLTVPRIIRQPDSQTSREPDGRRPSWCPDFRPADPAAQMNCGHCGHCGPCRGQWRQWEE